jgi:hypothetical protein
MDTIRGEPTWVNWCKSTWAIEEAMDDAATVGAMINDDLQHLIDDLPGTVDTWAKYYESIAELETFHHDILALVERARSIGLLKKVSLPVLSTPAE